MSSLAARRRHPAALVVLLMLGLALTGGLYALLDPKPAQASASASASQIAAGHQLFLANCATCHGLHGQGRSSGDKGILGPSLVGVGAAAVDFQVGTRRMPLAQPGVQAQPAKRQKFSDQQIADLAGYVASLGPGPAVPEGKYLTGGSPSKGGELFRVNCAMCHNFAGAGGALTRGKYAPSLRNTEGKYIYEAMATGPQSMPVFNDSNMSPQNKRDMIAYLHDVDKQQNPGGLPLGNMGPVPEGIMVWVFGLGLLIGAAIWLGRKAA